MNSASRQRAAVCLRGMLEELGEERVAAEVDRKLDAALVTATTPVEAGGELTERVFNMTIAHFVRTVYSRGLRCPRYLDDRAALAEAIDLLEAGYIGEYDRGYALARFEAGQDEVGMGAVLQTMSEIVRRRERSQYAQWVFARRFLSQDWQTRVEIVEQLKGVLTPYLPGELLGLDSAELVDFALELLLQHISTSSRVAQMVAC